MTENRKNFYEFLSPNNILCPVKSNTSAEVIQLLVEMLKRHYPELDIAAAAAEVTAREALFPTVIAPGLAVPHARLEGLKTPLVAMACVPDGVDFKAESGAARVVILLLSPADEPNLHMQILSALAKDLADPARIGQLAACRTPEEVLDTLAGSVAAMPAFLTAADVMSEPPALLRENDTLREAIRVFATTRAEELIVVDQSGDLRGVVALRDLLKYSLPEHLLWMENLSPIYLFQPLADVLKFSSETKVADVMREEVDTVCSSVPAIQLAKLFLAEPVSQLVITDANGRLAGVVGIREFCTRFFWA